MNTTNSFNIAGNLAADAKVSNLTNSNRADVRIAINRKEGDNQTTGWIHIQAYSKDKAKFDTLKKGQLIQFTGFFAPYEHDDKDGKHLQDVVLIATSWEPVSFEKKEKKEAAEAK